VKVPLGANECSLGADAPRGLACPNRLGVTQYTPGQLVFNKDMILRTHMEADMDMVRLRRQKAAIVNNERENKRRYKHKYKPGDKVLIMTQRLDPKLKLNDGPYTIEAYNQVNGTLQIR
jgi:hypothetical protein